MVNEALANKGVEILKTACKGYLSCSESTSRQNDRRFLRCNFIDLLSGCGPYEKIRDVARGTVAASVRPK